MNAAPLQPGDLLDGYEIVSLLGRGGMGVVYRARYPGVGEVALKTLLGDLASEEADRFRREVELLAALRHPGIVPVYAAGRARGFLYYAMGIVEGESLEAMIRRQGRLPPEEAARIVTEVAHAVSFAHERKIIHRDLKPANILLDAAGHAYVTDFGLGRQLGDDARRLTRTGEVLGTPWFMAPEQALGSKSIDERADVYGLGAILYCALAGRPPFVAATALETLELVRSSPPDPIEGLPPALEDLLARVLAKRPDDRPTTALDLARELEEALHARRGLPRGLLRGLLVVAAVCAVGTGALVWKTLERRRAGQGESGASPSPVSSAATPLRPNPRLATALGEVQLALERHTSVPPESLKQLKTLFTASSAEGERERIRVAVGRVHERVLEGDSGHFVQVADLDLPLPEDPGLRRRIAQRWVTVADERTPKERVDVQGIVQKLTTSDPNAPAIVADFSRKIASLGPPLAALRRARALDPSVSFFPPELEPLFRRLGVAAHVSAELTYRDAWRKVFAGLDDHPVRAYLEAKFELGELDADVQRIEGEQQTVHATALAALGHPAAELDRAAAAPRGLSDLYEKEVQLHPGAETLARAAADLERLRARSRDAQVRRRAVVLAHAERALPGLLAAGTPASRDLAEMFLFEVLRHLVWHSDPEKLSTAFESFAGLVQEGSKTYSLDYAKAGCRYTRGAASGWRVPDAKAVIDEWELVSHAAAAEHDLHLQYLVQSLAASPAPRGGD